MFAPENRVRLVNDAPIRSDGRYVVYWMSAQRRARFNYGLQHAVAHARELGVPLVVLEALSCSYRWASDRMHAFAVEGMRDNRDAFDGTPVTYLPYVEPSKGDGTGLHEALASEACVYVSDHWPCFHIPKWNRIVATKVGCRMETVDSCGLVPVGLANKAFSRAFDFRRYFQRVAFDVLQEMPKEDPIAGADVPVLDALPDAVTERWPATDLDALDLATLPIDHSVPPVDDARGGMRAGAAVLDRFMDSRFTRYEDRNHPDEDVASGLSPWLHWGHVSAHEVFLRVAAAERFDPARLEGKKATGKREGWWELSSHAEGFLDELITWREVCLNTSEYRADEYDDYASLPNFARTTLEEHADDPRPHVYSLEDFEHADTHDELWNAAQTQLRRDGIVHNYLRMLWGKKILHWSASPQEALRIMEELNNKYGLDGRDPNSYGGIMWVLGRYDRAWGPEREIFGKVRYMTSDNTRRKVRCKTYLAKYGGAGTLFS
ncbi:MAG: deoxyribodipyrimidine photolyase [Planctomycetota bacterium]